MAATLFRRAKGLLGTKDFRQGEALVITSCNSIHTFFMHFPIDVLFVDKAFRVIKAMPSLRPFRMTPLYFKADFALELPVGTIESSSTSEGDTLSLE
ncbi:MAG: hypothetical protein AMJ95_08445 [Omnitrophica WOR_2 bacterium SM23_72]|nr:MAG: hypothetical protein AMJ95_08445 [Omnitrophica WOR_2 bacterium SM23_72]